MKRPLAELERRRVRLVERSGALRARMAATAEPVTRKAAAADRIIAAVRERPLLAAVAAGALLGIGLRLPMRRVLQFASLYAILRK